MAKAAPGAHLPVLVVRGGHAEFGRAMGERQRSQIQGVVAVALTGFREQEIGEDDLREQNAPYLEAAARVYPRYLAELEAMAQGAEVPFEVLFRLNCYEARPPGTPLVPPPPAPPVPAKDPSVLPVANDPAAVASGPADGCTSVASRGTDGVVVGHTEDSTPQAIEGLYLVDATVEESDGAAPVGRFLALNYAQTLPGCAAAVNRNGLIVLIDALPDPDRRLGAPRHFVSRALLDQPDIESALDHLRRDGAWRRLELPAGAGRSDRERGGHGDAPFGAGGEPERRLRPRQPLPRSGPGGGRRRPPPQLHQPARTGPSSWSPRGWTWPA